jgi:PKD repeat protein
MALLHEIIKRNAYFALEPISYSQVHERVPSQSLILSSMTTGLASAIVIATAIILLTLNVTTINAQQFTNQPGEVIQNGTTTVPMTLFESRNDSFRVQVPEGWAIDDVNNTGSTLESELTQGYGILAELCPEEEEGAQQQQQALTNVSSSSNSSNSTGICQQQQAQDQIIHIVRYPNLSARLELALSVNDNDTTAEDILSYHFQALEEVGYRSIEIVNNTDTTVNVTNVQTNETIETVPAKFVEMTYATNFAPNEIREGYFISTATNATDPDPGVTKGYTVFYEGNSTTADVTSVAQTTTSDNLLPSLAPPVRLVFDSFELVAAEEVAQTERGGGPTITGSDDSGGGTTTTTTITDDNDDGDTGGGTTTNTTTITDDNDDGDTGGGGGGGPTITGSDDSGGGTTTTTITDDNDDSGGGTTTNEDDNDDSGGGTTTNEDDNDDSGGGPANLLTAEIVSNGTQDIAPATFEFQANVRGGTEPYTYIWNFDDNEDSGERDDEQNVVHTFNEAGTYNTTLTVIDSTGRTASDNILITVEQPPPLTSVEIISSGTEGVAPATFEFGADVVGGTAPYTYSWGFGDGSSGEIDDDETISHTFDLAGNYNVDLTVIDSSGQSASYSVEIAIEEASLPPEAEEQEQEEQQEQAAEPVCDSSYPDLCIPPPPPDLDCGDDGVPENFHVLPPDPHGFDSDNDGVACDSESNDAVVEPESPNNDSGTNVGRTSSGDDDKDATKDDAAA